MSRKPPKYALHKPSRQARVRINGKEIYLGEYNSPESPDEYDRLPGEFFLGTLDLKRDSFSIARLTIMFIEHVKSYGPKKSQDSESITTEACCHTAYAGHGQIAGTLDLLNFMTTICEA